MSAGALIKPSAFRRAQVIDAEMGWPRGLAIGRLATLWAQAQADNGKSIVRRRLILEWACVDAADGERFIAVCCKTSETDEEDDIHFLEPRGEDRYFIVGNPEQIDKIAIFRDRASAGGKAKAAKEASRRSSPPAGPSVSASSTASSTTTSIAPSGLKEPLGACPFPLPIPIPSPRPIPVSISTVDPPSTDVVDPPSTDVVDPLPEKRPPRSRAPTFSEADLAVGSEWLAFALQEMPWKTDDPSWTAETFAWGLAKVRRLIGLNDEGIAKLMEFVRDDSFWRKNAVSPMGLFKKSERNGERKIDNILVRMKSGSQSKEDRMLSSLKEWAEQ